jgi:hypothetical protein
MFARRFLRHADSAPYRTPSTQITITNCGYVRFWDRIFIAMYGAQSEVVSNGGNCEVVCLSDTRR